MMLEIDASLGEGGGQIIRSALALSTITGTPVHLQNIRVNRPKPGLAPQHLKAVKTLALISNAKVEGAHLRSTELTFLPGELTPLTGTVDIGTAGSITLLLQCVLPPLMSIKHPSSFRVIGGTDVLWSPSWDYMVNVTLKAMHMMGISVSASLVRRGYYPKGGGIVDINVKPSRPVPVSFMDTPTTSSLFNIGGRIHYSTLPNHIPERMLKSVRETLSSLVSDVEWNIENNLIVEHSTATSPGCGITLWQGLKGACAICERGLLAERVGGMAASSLIKEINSGAGVDIHLADQLVLYMGIAGGGSMTVRELTEHARTNMEVVERFLPVRFEVDYSNGLWVVRVKGSP